MVVLCGYYDVVGEEGRTQIAACTNRSCDVSNQLYSYPLQLFPEDGGKKFSEMFSAWLAARWGNPERG
jgi:hypothetical protein